MLRRQEGILKADVSHKRRTIEIETDGRSFTQEELTSLLSPHGYQVRRKERRGADIKDPVHWKRIGGSIILVVAAYQLLARTGLLTISPSAAEPAGLAAVFVVGLVASVSSCTAVVGGLVAAVAGSVAKGQNQFTRWERFRPHLFFNLGRVGGFAILGALVGLLGSVMQPSASLNGLLIVGVALAMLVLGVNLLELFPVSVVRMPKRLAHKVHDLSESSDPKAPLILGAMTFFLPCGFTQSMQLFALSLQDPFRSGLVMAIFALGTMPALLGIGGLTSVARGAALKKVTYAAGVLVLVLGISNMFNGFALLGIDPAAAFAKPTAASVAVMSDGIQRIQMEVTEYGTYEPDVLTVIEGVPVEWSIFGADFMGCANSLFLREFGIRAYLQPGFNTVTFTPDRTGRFTFSCSMGMVRGTMIVTPNE